MIDEVSNDTMDIDDTDKMKLKIWWLMVRHLKNQVIEKKVNNDKRKGKKVALVLNPIP